MNYRMRIAGSPADIDAFAWDALLATQSRPTPFLKHAFLAALTRTQCVTEETGWAPRFITLWDDADDDAPASHTDTDADTVSSADFPAPAQARLLAAMPL